MSLSYIESDLLKENCSVITHKSGLKIFVVEKPQSVSSYAIFGTHYGSIDTTFKRGGEDFLTVPQGIAHFLEHKLFESEQGDAFTRFSATGAQANAYTSFDKTCYLFSCCDRFYESLEILLDFVRHPYFTAKTVEKEMGIISQEIRMYDDSPGWCVMFGALKGLYSEHPVRIDIAGTTESIAEITHELLYSCYNTFYSPSNMFLCAAGNVEAAKIVEMVDRLVQTDDGEAIIRGEYAETKGAKESYSEKSMAVSIPLFCFGIKENISKPRRTAQEIVATKLILEVLFGKSSKLYSELVEKELIGEGFSFEYLYGYGYSALIFDGETNDPQKVAQALKDEIKYALSNGISDKKIMLAKRRLYGAAAKGFDSAEDIVSALVDSAVDEIDPFATTELILAINNDIVRDRINSFNPEDSTLSVINPIKN